MMLFEFVDQSPNSLQILAFLFKTRLLRQLYSSNDCVWKWALAARTSPAVLLTGGECFERPTP